MKIQKKIGGGGGGGGGGGAIFEPKTLSTYLKKKKKKMVKKKKMTEPGLEPTTSGLGGQGGCERRIEVFVKIQKKKIFFLGEGGGGVRGGVRVE